MLKKFKLYRLSVVSVCWWFSFHLLWSWKCSWGIFQEDCWVNQKPPPNQDPLLIITLRRIIKMPQDGWHSSGLTWGDVHMFAKNWLQAFLLFVCARVSSLQERLYWAFWTEDHWEDQQWWRRHLHYRILTYSPAGKWRGECLRIKYIDLMSITVELKQLFSRQ